MADTPRTELERAYRLIQQERLDEASALLQPLVKKDPNNADAWWLLANAVTEPEDARNALENVLRLTPNHAEARDLLDQLNAAASPMDDFGEIDFADPFAGLDAKPAGGPSTDLKALFDDDVPSFVREGSSRPAQAITGKTLRDFTTEDDEILLAALDAPTREAPTSGIPPKSQKYVKSGSPALAANSSPVAAPGTNRRLLPLGLAAIVALLILVVIVIILPALKSPPPPATVVANAVTAVPSAASTSVPLVATSAVTSSPVATTSAVATSAAIIASGTALPATDNGLTAAPTSASPGTLSPVSLGDVSAKAVESLKAAGIDNAQVNVLLTSVGQTLTARFCGPYGPKLDGNVRSAMDVVAAQGARVSDQIQGVGVEVDSCSDQTQVYAKAIAAIKDVVSYVNKTLTAPQFRADWTTS